MAVLTESPSPQLEKLNRKSVTGLQCRAQQSDCQFLFYFATKCYYT